MVVIRLFVRNAVFEYALKTIPVRLSFKGSDIWYDWNLFQNNNRNRMFPGMALILHNTFPLHSLYY